MEPGPWFRISEEQSESFAAVASPGVVLHKSCAIMGVAFLQWASIFAAIILIYLQHRS